MIIGLLGGTFDPVHQGHLDVARAARQAVGLDEVWLVPAREPPHRHRPSASAAHRFAMTALAAASEDWLRVSDVEQERSGPSYTIDTLAAVRKIVGPDAVICFLIGVDAFRDVPSWRAFPGVLDRCHFVVVSRPGAPAASVPGLLPQLAERMITAPCALPARPSILLVEAPTAAVSSTDVRRRLEERRPIDDLVPGPVAAHISRHGLYEPKEFPNA